MLTIAKVGVGASAASYYEGADDYYSSGRPPSSWFGAGAAQLGLAGDVNPESFGQLLAGQLPNGEKIHNAAAGRRGGSDLTFSAPKSVSLAVLVGKDSRLIDAHECAVRATLEYAQELAAYRVTDHGVTRTERSRALAVAMFRHDLSRDEDPQLHTHAVVLNVTPRADGAWRALDHSEFYRQQRLMGALYRSDLALRVKELGYDIRVTNGDGRWELAHIRDEQIAAFSNRSAAIENALAKLGKTRASATAKEKEAVALATRVAKTEVVRGVLHQRWAERSRELGIDYAEMHRATPSSAPNRMERKQAAEHAVRYAIEHTTEREAIVTEPQLVRAALERGMGSTNLIEIRSALQSAVDSGEVLKDQGRYTTPAAQRMERELLELNLRGRGAVAPIAPERTVRQTLTGTHLNEGQREAACAILTSDTRVLAIQGSAGTGKTTMLTEARQIADANGYQMVGLAPSAAAARELESAGVKSQTIAAFKTNRQKLDAKSVLVLDEASMVSTRDMKYVLVTAEAAKARVVLVGDVQQLKAVEAGRPFAQLQAAGIARAEMTEIQRQRDPNLRQAVAHASQGDVRTSLALLDTRIVEIETASKRYESIARDYAQLPGEQRANTLIVAGTRSARDAINDRVRRELNLPAGVTVITLERKDLTAAQARSSAQYQAGDRLQATKQYESMGLKRGDLATVIQAGDGRVLVEREDGQRAEWRPALQPNFVAYQTHERNVSVGDILRFTANDRAQGFINGERAHVITIDRDHSILGVVKEDGSLLSLNASRPLSIEHGYCSTVHSAQGKTCDRVLVEADTRSMTSNESAYYVAISRARDEVKVYTDDREMLPEAMSRTQDKTAALDLQAERAMSPA
ncbi:MobF family relaxase [Povalibacter sp.]|uniref:MobF family relaxase n=1 Tax=Povalibacter sp. TaxID=1962978 RepID=UPI002F42DD15